ncbi:MAG: murein L,D-transpeptidase family protein [Fimbriimonadaceae bacterium]
MRVWLCLPILLITQTACNSDSCKQKPTATPNQLGAKSNKPYPKKINALYIRAFKTEKELELWIQEKPNQKYTHYHTYPVLRTSGRLGPKRKEYDGQVPEGYYVVDRFNPKSRFHLSLGINYPNASDLKRSDPKKPGSDIFIHGSNVSIGCLAMGNSAIEEIYAIAEVARKSPYKINVDIYPYRMSNQNLKKYSTEFPKLADFWKEIQPGFLLFEQTRRPSLMHADENGKYVLHK